MVQQNYTNYSMYLDPCIRCEPKIKLSSKKVPKGMTTGSAFPDPRVLIKKNFYYGSDDRICIPDPRVIMRN
jgi:hypothetical protein